MIGSVSLLLVTRPDLPASNLSELVALMRKEPGRLNYASPGKGTMHHLLVEMINAQEKLTATHVPYQGSMAALTDLLTGNIADANVDAADRTAATKVAPKPKPTAKKATRKAAGKKAAATTARKTAAKKTAAKPAAKPAAKKTTKKADAAETADVDADK